MALNNTTVIVETTALNTPVSVATTTLNTHVIVETMTLDAPVTMETMTLNNPVTMETMTHNNPVTMATTTLNTPISVETMTLDTPITREIMKLNAPFIVETMALDAPVIVETMTLDTPDTMVLNTPVTMETTKLNTPVTTETTKLNTPVTMENMALNTPIIIETMTLDTPITTEITTLNAPVIVETMALDAPIIVETMALDAPIIIETMALDAPIIIETMALDAPIIVETMALDTPASGIPTVKEPLSRTSSTPLPLSSGPPGHHRGLRQSASYHLGVPQPHHRGPSASSCHRGDRAPPWSSSGSESEAEPEEEEDDAHSGGSSSSSSQSGCTVYCVVLLGDHGVGKSTLAGIFAGRADEEEGGEESCGQFRNLPTSGIIDGDTKLIETAGFLFMNTYERTLAVDGQETTLIVMDTWDNDKLEEEDPCMKVGSAYVIVYSITDRASFDSASELRIQLRRMRQADNIPIILVGNKSDLVRSREVAVEEGRKCAVVFDCKFIETSAALQHNVAELFEGVVRQIRLHRNHADREERGVATGHGRRPHGKRKESVTQKARRFLDRLVAKNNQRVAAKVRSKSCHDLAVL